MDHDSRILQGDELHKPIWRYMKLSTFLWMIRERKVFIPTLATLQRTEPTEGRLAEEFQIFPSPTFEERFNNKIGKWLRNKASAEEKAELQEEVDRGRSDSTWTGSSDILRTIWLREIAKRRYVWCWFGSKHESIAQWRLYADGGIAIRSTPQLVIEALDLPGGLPVKAWPVFYASADHRIDRPKEMPSGNEVMRRPFILKSIAFEYEKEIRFVFPQRKYSWGGSTGATVTLKHTSFIQEIKTSPDLHGGEDVAIRTLIDEILGQKITSASLALSPYQMLVTERSIDITPKAEPSPLYYVEDPERPCESQKEVEDTETFGDSPSFFEEL